MVSGFFISTVVLFFVSIGLMCLNGMLIVNGQWNRENVSPYECGFEPINHARVSFSLRFYVVMVLFVIFDVEVVLIVPLLFSFYGAQGLMGICSWSFFMVLMVLGCLYERRDGSIDWVEDSKNWTVVSNNYAIRSVPNSKLYGRRQKL